MPMGDGATLVSGNTTTQDMLSNRIPIDMNPEITRKHEMNSPFTVLLDLLDNFKTCMGRKAEWMERDDYQNTVALSSAYTADDGVLTMADDYHRVRLGDVLYHPGTDKYYLVTTSGVMDATVDVEDNWPTLTGGLAMAAGEELYLIGNAQDEFSDVRQLLSAKPVPKYNLLQTNRNPFGVSGRLNACEVIGPAEIDYLDADHFRAFGREREMGFLMGIRGLQASTDITASGGIYWWMNQAGSGCHQRDMTGKILTQSEWEDYLKDAMYYMSGTEKLLITGRNIPAYLNGFARKHLRVDMDVAKWGIRIQIYETPDGILRILRHKLFTELNMDDQGWVVDMGSLRRRGLAGERSTPHLNTGPGGFGLQGNGEDGVKYEYFVEECLELNHSERFSRIYNVAAP